MCLYSEWICLSDRRRPSGGLPEGHWKHLYGKVLQQQDLERILWQKAYCLLNPIRMNRILKI